MLCARDVSGLVLAGAGLLSLCTSLAEIDARSMAQSWRPDRLHPVAALAWAGAHCDADLTLSRGTPRLQAEDLLEMSAGLDLAEREQGREAACAGATALADSVAAEGTEASASRNGLVASVR
jgi:hypothetical protein